MVTCPCGQPVLCKGVCRSCYQRAYRAARPDLWRKYVKPRTPKPRKPRTLSDTITYHGAHSRVRTLRGKASDTYCIDCGWQAQDWSYRGGCPLEQVEQRTNRHGATWAAPYSPNPWMYDAMCKSCHAVRDGRPGPDNRKRNRTLRQRAGEVIHTTTKVRSRTW